MPYILSGDVSFFSARKLVKILRDRAFQDVDWDGVESVCRKEGMHSDEYRFRFEYALQNYDSAYEVLKRLPMEKAFLHHYMYATHHLRFDLMIPAYRWASEQLNSAEYLSLDFYIAAREIAATVGYLDTTSQQFHMRLLESFAKWPALNSSDRLRALWQIGFPIIPDVSGLSEEIMRVMPGALSQQIDMAGYDVPLSVSGWSTMLNLLTLNALEVRQRAVMLSNEGILSDVIEVNDVTLVVRFLGEGYWRQADNNAQQASFLSAFKAATKRAGRSFARVCPIAATQIYDMRGSDISGLPTLSYHTISDYGQRCLNFKESPLPGYFLFDRAGFSGWASGVDVIRDSKQEHLDQESFFEQLRDTYVTNRLTKYSQNTRGSTPFPSKFVFIALQVPNDTVSSLAFLSREDLICTTAKFYRGTNTQVLVKVHPLDKSQSTQAMLQMIQKAYANVQITIEPIHYLISRATAILTINSGVGFESLLHLKPVITAGASDYSEVATLVHNVSELRDTLLGIEDQTRNLVDSARIKSFLYHYLTVRCFSVDHFPDAFDEIVADL